MTDKFCIDCEFYEKPLWCVHPSNGICPVNGIVVSRIASVKRSDLSILFPNEDFCMPEGKYWKQKQVQIKPKQWWRFWK